MSVSKSDLKPECMAHFPDGKYTWLRLHDGVETYGHAAIGKQGDDLELHVTMIRWGPGIRRQIQGDVEWLKHEARQRGFKRILGVRGNSCGEFDENFFRFARLFGFTEVAVLQMAAVSLDAEEGVL